jgi:hypothetical protein
MADSGAPARRQTQEEVVTKSAEHHCTIKTQIIGSIDRSDNRTIIFTLHIRYSECQCKLTAISLSSLHFHTQISSGRPGMDKESWPCTAFWPHACVRRRHGAAMNFRPRPFQGSRTIFVGADPCRSSEDLVLVQKRRRSRARRRLPVKGPDAADTVRRAAGGLLRNGRQRRHASLAQQLFRS